MYDGSPFAPKVDSFLQLAGQQGVTHLGVSPRYFSTLQAAGVVPNKIPGLQSLELCTSTGMVLPTSLLRWFYSEKGFPKHVHLANISGGTDIAGAFVDGNVLEPLYDVGGCQTIALGMDVRVFDSTIENEKEDVPVRGREVPMGQPGDLVCIQSFPNMPVYFWADKDGSKYRKAYFARFDNVWTQGDFIHIEPKTKSIILLGRADGVLNPSGVRFGSAEVYTVIESKFKTEIEDTICVGQRRKDDQDENVLLFVKMRSGKKFDNTLIQRVKEAIAEGLSRRHVPRFVFETKEIPVLFPFFLVLVDLR
jgi:acetoacetyl-CoA synthetase